MIEHTVSAYHDITHAAGLAIINPSWMRSFLQYRQADTTTVTFHAKGLRIDRWTFDVGHSGSPPNYFAIRPSLAALVKLSRDWYAGRIPKSPWHRQCEVRSAQPSHSLTSPRFFVCI